MKKINLSREIKIFDLFKGLPEEYKQFKTQK